ncbi:MAG: hypothetical protein ACYDCC_11870 [Actinomycetota bacterium]
MQSSFASYRFARRISRGAWAPLRNPGDVVFVEDSFEIFDNETPRDFRELIDDVIGGAGRRWTPNDPYARYLPSGALVTADETEALLAIAPVRMQRELSSNVADEVLARRAELSMLLKNGLGEAASLKGYASSLAAFVSEDRASQVAARFARTAAPAMMLLLDLSSTPGVLLRTNGPRVEIVTEHIATRDDLRAAMMFFLGCVIAIEHGIAFPELETDMQPEPADGALLAERDGFGDDIFVNGRMACLKLAQGGTILAGSLFGEIWGAIRFIVEAFSSTQELTLLDDLVSGAAPLPCERDPIAPPTMTQLKPVLELAGIVRERRRGDITVTPASVTWDSATLSISTSSRTVFARVRLEQFESFAKAFDRGRLDKPIASFSRASSKGRVASEDSSTGLYDLAEIPLTEASMRLVRVGEPSALEGPGNQKARPTLRLSKRITTYIAAAAMFAGTATFAFSGLRQPELQPSRLGPRFALSSNKPFTKVLGDKQTRPAEPKAKVQKPALPPSVSAPQQTHQNDTQSNPPPAPQQSNPNPGPTQTTPPPPPPTATPTPTPTPTPTQTQTPTNTSKPTVSGSIACGVGTSSLSFTVTTQSGAPQITKILVEYSGTQQAISPSPTYPTSSYQGNANAAISVNSNHRWSVTVQDQSGQKPETTYFIEGTGGNPKCS